MTFLRTFSRIFLGLVFIFSGFVKGIDPLGTTYRIEDYFIAYGTEWALPFVLFLSIFLCTLEFVLGVTLVFNIKLKQISWILFLMMAFFTILTLYDAIYNPVPDCGCFGDAIKLSNWATFYKNVFLMVFVLIVFINRKKIKSPLSGFYGYSIILIATILFSWFSVYSYNHLPSIDFRGWKVGKDMEPENNAVEKVYLTYKNKKTDEVKEYLSPDYPWNDSVWMSEWEFVDQRIDDSETVKHHELKIEDEFGEDYTDNFIKNPHYQFIIVAWSLDETNKKAFNKINEYYKNTENDGHTLIVLTSEQPENIKRFAKKDVCADYEFYNADDIVLKTMIRANPGLILMKNGVVLAKWHYNDFPEYSEIKRKYID